MSDEIFAAVHARPKRRQGITGQTIDAQMRGTMCQITEWELEELCDELARLRAEVERLTAALADERAHADALAEDVEMFATDRNWQQGGPFDPCSPSFTGTAMASAVVKQHRARRQG